MYIERKQKKKRKNAIWRYRKKFFQKKAIVYSIKYIILTHTKYYLLDIFSFDVYISNHSVYLYRVNIFDNEELLISRYYLLFFFTSLVVT